MEKYGSSTPLFGIYVQIYTVHKIYLYRYIYTDMVEVINPIFGKVNIKGAIK